MSVVRILFIGITIFSSEPLSLYRNLRGLISPLLVKYAITLIYFIAVFMITSYLFLDLSFNKYGVVKPQSIIPIISVAL